MSDDYRRSIRAARIATYRKTLSGPLTANDRDWLRGKLDTLLRLQACDAPLSQGETDSAAVLSGEAMQVGERSSSRREEAAPSGPSAPAPGLTPRAD